MEGKKVLKILASNSRCHALTSEGQVFGWGAGAELGAGLSGNQLVPTLIDISNIPSGKFITNIFAGTSTMAIVVRDSPPTELDFEDSSSTSCYNTLSTSPVVCSSRGSCIAENYCKCNQGYGGYICQRKCADCYLNYKL